MEVTQFTYLEPIRIKVERGQRGGVGWEISIHGKNSDEILKQIKDIESKLIQFELETPPQIKRQTITTHKEGE